MKEVFIISTLQIYNGKTAGSQRLMNIAKSLAYGEINVYLCSLNDIFQSPLEKFEFYPNIFQLRSKNVSKKRTCNLFRFIISLNKFLGDRKSKFVLYLYPTGIVIKELVFLLYFKFIKRYHLFCDINELRVTNLYTLTPPSGLFRKILFFGNLIKNFLVFKLSEIQIYFYDGIIVISRNLESYFYKYSKTIIRIPILCDMSGKDYKELPVRYQSGIFKLCFTGSVIIKKEGFDLLLEAIARINYKKNVELYLYGAIANNDKDMLNFLTEHFNVRNKVFYMGNILPEELSNEYTKYNLLILPRPLNKQTHYGFSTKLSEYLVSGVPVLVTNVSDNGLYIKDDFNGFIIQPGSISEMISKINYLIDNYNSLYKIITKNAYRTASENFDNRLFTEILINFFFHDYSYNK